jgi:hypothetical protein
MKTFPINSPRALRVIAVMAAALIAAMWLLDHFAGSAAQTTFEHFEPDVIQGPPPHAAVTPTSGHVVTGSATQPPLDAAPKTPQHFESDLLQGPPLPGSVTPASGRVAISPALQLPVNAAPPVTCSLATLGTLVLAPNARLCLCDGFRWQLPNLNEPCDWKAPP